MEQRNKRRSNKLEKKGISMWVIIGIVVVVITGIYLILTQQRESGSSKMPSEISVNEAARLRDEGALILDVREKNEWIDYHIPDATLLPLGTLPNKLASLPKDKTIVVVCRTGRRSAEGRDILLKAGFTIVTSMAGGMMEWKSTGLPVVTGE